VSDQTIDNLIKLAQKKRAVSNDDKLDILQVVALKTGIHLNKHTLLERITLVEHPQIKEISVNY
jgi:hypothetical protein